MFKKSQFYIRFRKFSKNLDFSLFFRNISILVKNFKKSWHDSKLPKKYQFQSQFSILVNFFRKILSLVKGKKKTLNFDENFSKIL